uniref:Ribonuclease P n=1 Tax=Globodera rostochiensis TaxID=31243 RepID=A0A914H9W6_GLORO
MMEKRRWRASQGGMEPGKVHKLTVNLEFGGVRVERFTFEDFQALVDSAIGRVLGTSAPTYAVCSFDGHAMRGALLADGADLHILWAALSVYGMHFEQPMAFHLYSVHKQRQIE